MDLVPEDRRPTPLPALPKTIGVLNLLFGGLLFLCGIGCLNRMAPNVSQWETFVFPVETYDLSYDQLRGETIRALAHREKSAAGEAQKAEFRRLRLELEALPASIRDQFDAKALNREMRWASWYVWADVITGPILNLLMLASGIGLIRLYGWARRLALWVAALKILRLVALGLFLFFAVVPHFSSAMKLVFATDLGKVTLAKVKADQLSDPAVAGLNGPGDLGRVFEPFGKVMTLAFLAFAAIYPAVSLVLLSRPGARAACEESDDADGDDADRAI